MFTKNGKPESFPESHNISSGGGGSWVTRWRNAPQKVCATKPMSESNQFTLFDFAMISDAKNRDADSDVLDFSESWTRSECPDTKIVPCMRFRCKHNLLFDHNKNKFLLLESVLDKYPELKGTDLESPFNSEPSIESLDLLADAIVESCYVDGLVRPTCVLDIILDSDGRGLSRDEICPMLGVSRDTIRNIEETHRNSMKRRKMLEIFSFDD